MVGYFEIFSYKPRSAAIKWTQRHPAATSLLLTVLLASASEQSLAEGDTRYTNDWAVEVWGGPQAADRLAREQGFLNMGGVGNLKDVYRFVLNEGEFAPGFPGNARGAAGGRERRSLQSLELLEQPFRTAALRREKNVGYVMQQEVVQMYKRSYEPPRDPDWPSQWSLFNSGQTSGPVGLDLNVEPVWMQGINGKGVVVSVVDDGLETEHPDLHINYDAQASHDFIDQDNNPSPYYSTETPSLSDYHGTACAGVIGMVRNSLCGVGVAPGASIGGLRLNLSFTTDITQAAILGFQDDYVDIYSNSWGPLETGFTVGGPGYLMKQALKYETDRGRNWKGSIYVFASGNGGKYYDSCAADGFVNSIYTIAVGSADQNGHQADYDEDCSAKMAVTFSYNSNTFSSSNDNSKTFKQMYTTSLNGECSNTFTGTSASAPLVSGVLALALEANPDLTWRDVQYLIAYTSNPDLLTGDDWVTNGAGLRVSHHFGFGAIDAEAMVTRAKYWSTVPPQQSQTFFPTRSIHEVPASSSIVLQFVVDNSNLNFRSVRFLEHVVLTASLHVQGFNRAYDFQDFFLFSSSVGNNMEALKDWLKDPHPRRGDIQLELTSPQGTSSIVLPYRDYDFVNSKGYQSWPFMSVHYWGENPTGVWTLRIRFRSSAGSVSISGVTLTLHGASFTPQSVHSLPAQCNAACSRGCSGEGPDKCDVCRNLRIASTLHCVDDCPSDHRKYHSYCLCNATNCTASLSDDHTVMQRNSTYNSTDHLPLQWTIAILLSGSFLIISLILLIVTILFVSYREHKKRCRTHLSVPFMHLQENIYSSTSA